MRMLRLAILFVFIFIIRSNIAAAQCGNITINDPAEYNAYVAATTQTDPIAKLNALNQFLAQYPNSTVKVSILETLLRTYSDGQDVNGAFDTAKLILRADQNNLLGLLYVVWIENKTANGNRQVLADAAVKARLGLSVSKPACMSDSDFQAWRNAATPTFNGAIAMDPGPPAQDSPSEQAVQSSQASESIKVIGKVIATTTSTIMVKPDQGTPTNIAVSPTARIVRVPYGTLDMSAAQSTPLSDVVIGDRVLLQVAPAQGSSSTASFVVVEQPAVGQQTGTDSQATQAQAAAPQPADNGAAQRAELEQKKQDIADQIEQLQSDKDEQESDAENWDQQAESLGDTSRCTGPSAAICVSIAQIAVNKAQSNARKARQAAQSDQEQINDLQGQSTDLDQQISNAASAPAAQPSSYDPNAIVNAGNQQAAQIRAVGDANAAARNNNAAKSNGSAPSASGQNSKGCVDQHGKPIPGSESWKACPGW